MAHKESPLTTIAISRNRLDAALICIIIRMAHLIQIRSFHIFTISKTFACVHDEFGQAEAGVH